MECYQKKRLGQEPGKTAAIISQPQKMGSVLWGVCLRSGQSLKRESTGHWGKGHPWDAQELLSCVKSTDTWSNRQIWPWSTKWSRAKANRVLPGERTGHSKHPLPTTQEKTLHMDITRWSIPKSDWLYFVQPKMEKRYTISKNKTRSWLWLRSWTPYCKIQTKIEESREDH